MRVAKPEKLSETIKEKIYKLELTTFGSSTLHNDEIDLAYWWFAYHKGEVIGFTGLIYYPYLKQPAAFLYRSGVLKDWRGYGLQKRFIKVREKQAIKDGYNRIITYTSYDNLASANSLISCGYKLYSPPSSWGVKNAYYFQKMF